VSHPPPDRQAAGRKIASLVPGPDETALSTLVADPVAEIPNEGPGMTDSTLRIGLDDAQRAKIKSIVCEILEIEPSEMTDTSRFKDDHDADSLGAIEILSALERAMGIEIEQDQLTRMVNLDGVVAVVEDAMAAQ
jgi:acyl carrier protein